jgi:hypothetical protein
MSAYKTVVCSSIKNKEILMSAFENNQVKVEEGENITTPMWSSRNGRWDARIESNEISKITKKTCRFPIGLKFDKEQIKIIVSTDDKKANVVESIKQIYSVESVIQALKSSGFKVEIKDRASLDSIQLVGSKVI